MEGEEERIIDEADKTRGCGSSKWKDVGYKRLRVDCQTTKVCLCVVGMILMEVEGVLKMVRRLEILTAFE